MNRIVERRTKGEYFRPFISDEAAVDAEILAMQQRGAVFIGRLPRTSDAIVLRFRLPDDDK